MLKKIEDVRFNHRNNTKIIKKDLAFQDYKVSTIKTDTNYPKIRSEYSSSEKNKNLGLKSFFILILFIAILYFSSVFFEVTKVEIENKKQSFTLDNKKMNTSKDSNASIPFEIMIVNDEEMKNITLSDTQEASSKSKGEILFYNEYSTTPQKLLANTYIKDEEGKLYTLDSEVIIPGYTLDKEKRLNAGTVSTTASSFLIGESYNGEPKEFTVNSFKGTTKLNKIYARAKTPFKGGALGLVYVLNANDKGVLNSYAATSFKNNLYRKVGAQIPEGYILYPNAISFSYNINGDSFFKNKESSVPITGVLSAVIFKKSDLANALVKNLLPKITEEEFKEISVLNLDNLKFNFIDTEKEITKDLNSIDFTLNGNLNMIWNINTPLIQSKLVGVSKESVQGILKEDPGIKNAIIKVFPPWSSYLPKEVSKIKIEIK